MRGENSCRFKCAYFLAAHNSWEEFFQEVNVDILVKTAAAYGISTRQIFSEICESYKLDEGRECMLWEGYRQELFLPAFILISCQYLLISLYEDRLCRHIDTPLFTWADAQRLMQERKPFPFKEGV